MAKQIPLTCSGHTRPVVDVSFSGEGPNGFFLISACKDGSPMLRKGDTGDWIGTFEGHKGAVWSATLKKDATLAATGAADFTAKVWDAITGDELSSLPHKHIVRTVDFSPEGDKLLTGSNEKLLRIFNLQKPESEPDVLRGHTDSIREALWKNDATQIFSGGDDKSIWLWDTRTLEQVKKIDVGQSITSMELTRDGAILLVTYAQTVSFWDTESLEMIKSYELPTPVFSASLHPDKSCFVAGGDDFKLYKFDYSTGKEIESYKGHFGPVHCVRYSPDGELYASGSEDGTLRLWQHTVGQTYGLWRSVANGADAANGSESGKS